MTKERTAIATLDAINPELSSIQALADILVTLNACEGRRHAEDAARLTSGVAAIGRIISDKIDRVRDELNDPGGSPSK